MIVRVGVNESVDLNDPYVIWPRYTGRDKGLHVVFKTSPAPGEGNCEVIGFASAEAARAYYSEKHPFSRDFRVLRLSEYEAVMADVC